MNLKTSLPDWNKRQELMGLKSTKRIEKYLSTMPTIMMNGQNLEEVDAFKYVWSTLSKYGTSTMEIKIRIAVAMSAM